MTSARAQTDLPPNARVLSESLAIAPTVQLTDVGWNDNVLRVNKADRPTSDFTATLTPALEAWFRVPGVRVRGRSEVDFVYFKDVSEFRSIDTDNSARAELLLGRVTPFVSGSWTNARHRRNFEIDSPVRRVDWAWDTGADVRLTGKTSFGLIMRRSRADYKGDTIYLDTDLARYLGATATAYGARIRYAVTPLTNIGANVERFENRFANAPERDSDGSRVVAVLEIAPLAQLSGTASVGVTKRTFVDGDVPPFQGTVALVDLAYTLLGRTRFGVALQRDLSYSYRADQRDYLQTGVQVSVTHYLASAWDVTGTVGRFRLWYGVGEASDVQVRGEARAERVLGYSVDLGYRIGRTRTGFQVARQTRTSDFSVGRGYEETRVGSFLSFGF